MRTWLLVAAALALSGAFVGVLAGPSVGSQTVTLVSNGGQLLAAGLASAGCAAAARRSTGGDQASRRRAWLWLSVGTGSWAAGQAVWSYYEVIAAQEVPFPSLADVGFLGFPIAAAAGLVIWLGMQTHEFAARGRDVLDGAIIAGSLLVLSWVTSLGSVVAAGADSWAPFALSLAYPVGDLVLATLVLIALARGTGAERTTLAVLAAGLGGLAVSDSGYLYLVNQGSYSSADLVSSGWVLGFLLVGAAGLTVRRSGAQQERRGTRLSTDLRTSRLRLCLPYAPLLAAGAVLGANLLAAPRAPTGDLLLGIGLVGLVLLRQFLAMADNQRLLSQLAVARDQLQHQALHDPLTGVANRVLFADRLEQALLRRHADVAVLYCDLDDFKNVNDQLGHEAGDAVLRVVAQRLLGCVRATDTVARLGGDEFAILLEDGHEPGRAAARVIASMHEAVEVAGQPVPASMSIGISRRRSHSSVLDRGTVDVPEPAGEAAAEAALLVREADTAMYAAKGAGKDRAVVSPATDGRAVFGLGASEEITTAAG